MQALLRGGWVRPKLELGAPDDPEEREADATAERVMRMPEGACCSSCAGGGTCDDETLRRKASAAGAAHPQPPGGLERQVRGLTAGGEALSPGLRRFFEPRMGRELGAVRIHRGHEAQRAAGSIRARAFTIGQHVGFAAGQWAPDTGEGRRLLAHELAHTGQAAGSVRRQAVPEPVPPFVPAPGQQGTEISRRTRPGVRRFDVVIRRTTSCGWNADLDLVFDPDGDCLVETGRTVDFVHPTTTHNRLPPDQFEALASRFLAAANDYLDGWFAIRITGDDAGCGAPCRDKAMPIRVRLRRQAGGHAITLTSGSGRENAGHVYGSTSAGTLRHEAGHVALGISDEYEESGVACREGEHVEERDYSLMASHHVYGRRSLLHPRHFSHVVHWFETEYPRCRVELVPLKQPSPIDVDLSIGMGAGGIGGISGVSLSAGIGVGIPLDRLRSWMLTVGPHAHMLTAFGDTGSRDVYLAGLRFGLERRFRPSATGPFLGGFVEAGYGSFSLRDWDRGIDQTERGAYGLVGGRAGINFAAPLLPSLALEGSAGTPIGAPGRIGDAVPVPRESFWQLGIVGAFRF